MPKSLRDHPIAPFGVCQHRRAALREARDLPIRPLRMRSFATPALNLEVNHRNLTAIYLYSPQRIILPSFIDIYLVVRGLYRY